MIFCCSGELSITRSIRQTSSLEIVTIVILNNEITIKNENGIDWN